MAASPALQSLNWRVGIRRAMILLTVAYALAAAAWVYADFAGGFAAVRARQPEPENVAVHQVLFPDSPKAIGVWASSRDSLEEVKLVLVKVPAARREHQGWAESYLRGDIGFKAGEAIAELAHRGSLNVDRVTRKRVLERKARLERSYSRAAWSSSQPLALGLLAGVAAIWAAYFGIGWVASGFRQT